MSRNDFQVGDKVLIDLEKVQSGKYNGCCENCQYQFTPEEKHVFLRIAAEGEWTVAAHIGWVICPRCYHQRRQKRSEITLQHTPMMQCSLERSFMAVPIDVIMKREGGDGLG